MSELVSKLKAELVITAGVVAVVLSLSSLGFLLWDIFRNGWDQLSLQFLTNFPSRFPEKAGVLSALLGTFYVVGLTALISVPIGVLTAVYLEEFTAKNWITRFIRLNISNLAGVPSIVYGIFGLSLFVRFLALGRSIFAGALTMSLLILPVIILAAAEAIRAVPESIRMGAFGVGATRWQTVWSHVLPEALPGIVTGIILALSRAIGESAPLIMIGAVTFIAFTPQSILDPFTVLSIQVFDWAGRPQEGFHRLAATAIIVLLAVTLGMNSIAIYIRTRLAKRRGQ